MLAKSACGAKVGGRAQGTSIDALVLLEQTPAMDRAAMNLFQNWNYSAAASE